jgi:hypothetical protein
MNCRQLNGLPLRLGIGGGDAVKEGRECVGVLGKPPELGR